MKNTASLKLNKSLVTASWSSTVCQREIVDNCMADMLLDIWT